MKRRISAVEARKRLGELLEGVYYRGDEVVFERAGKPMGVIISPARYRAIEYMRKRAFRMIDKIHERNKDVPYEVIEAEVAAAVREVREAERAKRTE